MVLSRKAVNPDSGRFDSSQVCLFYFKIIYFHLFF